MRNVRHGPGQQFLLGVAHELAHRGVDAEEAGACGLYLELAYATDIEHCSVSRFELKALLHLGEIEDPMSGRLDRDLGAAKHVIDILGILKDKTKGNLEQSEERLLDAVLYDLRMRYVELMRGSPKEEA